MEIRRATLEDAAGIARVQVDSYRTVYASIFPAAYLAHLTYEEQEQDWRELLSAAGNEVLYVAVTNQGEMIGYALSRRNPDEVLPYDGELVALHVRRDHQRQGWGRQLFAAASRELATQGCNSLFLWVLADNPARLFYEKLGGKRLGEKAWQNNEYFGTHIYEVVYGWTDIRLSLRQAQEQRSQAPGHGGDVDSGTL